MTMFPTYVTFMRCSWSIQISNGRQWW